MNIKWKIALLSVLGFSAAACCNTKKCSKSEDADKSNIESESEDPRIMLMYGVPFPDGTMVRPVEDGEQVPPPPANPDGVTFPDGAVVHPISSDDVQKLKEQLKAEQEAAASQEEPRIQRPGVPFPDGEVFKVVSDEEVERLTKEAKKKNRKSKKNNKN